MTVHQELIELGEGYLVTTEGASILIAKGHDGIAPEHSMVILDIDQYRQGMSRPGETADERAADDLGAYIQSYNESLEAFERGNKGATSMEILNAIDLEDEYSVQCMALALKVRNFMGKDDYQQFMYMEVRS